MKISDNGTLLDFKSLFRSTIASFYNPKLQFKKYSKIRRKIRYEYNTPVLVAMLGQQLCYGIGYTMAALTDLIPRSGLQNPPAARNLRVHMC